MGEEKIIDAMPPLVFGILFGLLSGMVVVGNTEHKAAYRQGQIDALSGQKIKYELLPQPDGTVVWVEKEAKP